MIRFVYAYRNNLIGAYADPFLNQYKPDEVKELFVRSLAGLKVEQLEQIKECDIYQLGSFDDKSGKFDLLECPELVVTCASVVIPLIESCKVSEVKQDE